MTLNTTLENRRRALRRRHKAAYLAHDRRDVIEHYMENRRQASHCLSSRRYQKTPCLPRDSGDAIGKEVVKATPPQDTDFLTNGPRDANGHEVGKPTLSVATSLAMPPQDAIFWTDEPQDPIGYDDGKPTPNVATAIIATQPKDATFTAGDLPDTI
jgi:hypothetical protein